jgi:hypothetical protein
MAPKSPRAPKYSKCQSWATSSNTSMGPQLWYRCKIPSMALHLTPWSLCSHKSNTPDYNPCSFFSPANPTQVYREHEHAWCKCDCTSMSCKRKRKCRDAPICPPLKQWAMWEVKRPARMETRCEQGKGLQAGQQPAAQSATSSVVGHRIISYFSGPSHLPGANSLPKMFHSPFHAYNTPTQQENPPQPPGPFSAPFHLHPIFW